MFPLLVRRYDLWRLRISANCKNHQSISNGDAMKMKPNYSLINKVAMNWPFHILWLECGSSLVYGWQELSAEKDRHNCTSFYQTEFTHVLCLNYSEVCPQSILMSLDLWTERACTYCVGWNFLCYPVSQSPSARYSGACGCSTRMCESCRSMMGCDHGTGWSGLEGSGRLHAATPKAWGWNRKTHETTRTGLFTLHTLSVGCGLWTCGGGYATTSPGVGCPAINSWQPRRKRKNTKSDGVSSRRKMNVQNNEIARAMRGSAPPPKRRAGGASCLAWVLDLPDKDEDLVLSCIIQTREREYVGCRERHPVFLLAKWSQL